MGVPLRGEVWLVSFDPSVGQEIRKNRPAVVVSVDVLGRLPLRIAVPITGWRDTYAQCPWMVHLAPDQSNGLAKESAADAFQVKPLSVNRFVKRLGVLTGHELREVAAAIGICVGVP